MPVASNLSLKVNGHQYSRVGLRLSIEGGYPGGPWEVLIEDDLLGQITLTPEFIVELKEGDDDWKTVTLPYLIAMLQSNQS